MSHDHEPIISPEVEELKNACTLLRDELAGLFVERDILINTVIPNLQAQYATRIGVKELEALELEVEVRRLKRMIEGIQSVENSGKKANLEQIEAQVEHELQDWRVKVEQMLAAVEAGKNFLKARLSVEESQELQKLYRKLAKKLHPDVNPGLSEEHKLLWGRVSKAYEAADLQELRAVELMLDDLPAGLEVPNVLEELKQRKRKLKDQITMLMREIEEIQSAPPCSLADDLEDPEWVQAKVDDIEKRIAAFVSEKEMLEAWISAWSGKQ